MITNLTPHPVTVIAPDGASTLIPPSGTVARCATSRTPAGTADGFPIFRTSYGAVAGLPDPVAGTWFIVSALVRTACPSRTDLLSPADLVRDASGAIVGCKSFDVN